MWSSKCLVNTKTKNVFTTTEHLRPSVIMKQCNAVMQQSVYIPKQTDSKAWVYDRLSWGETSTYGTYTEEISKHVHSENEGFCARISQLWLILAWSANCPHLPGNEYVPVLRDKVLTSVQTDLTKECAEQMQIRVSQRNFAEAAYQQNIDYRQPWSSCCFA